MFYPVQLFSPCGCKCFIKFSLVQRDIESKITIFHTPCIQAFIAPVKGIRRSFATIFCTKKLQWGATRRYKKFNGMFTRFDRIHERNRQTDRQTDRQTVSQPPRSCRLPVTRSEKNRSTGTLSYHDAGSCNDREHDADADRPCPCYQYAIVLYHAHIHNSSCYYTAAYRYFFVCGL